MNERTMRDIAHRQRAATLHEPGAEKTLVVAVVRDHLHAHRYGARGFAPDRHLAGVTAELGDVFMDPLQSDALVAET